MRPFCLAAAVMLASCSSKTETPEEVFRGVVEEASRRHPSASRAESHFVEEYPREQMAEQLDLLGNAMDLHQKPWAYRIIRQEAGEVEIETYVSSAANGPFFRAVMVERDGWKIRSLDVESVRGLYAEEGKFYSSKRISARTSSTDVKGYWILLLAVLGGFGLLILGTHLRPEGMPVQWTWLWGFATNSSAAGKALYLVGIILVASAWPILNEMS